MNWFLFLLFIIFFFFFCRKGEGAPNVVWTCEPRLPPLSCIFYFQPSPFVSPRITNNDASFTCRSVPTPLGECLHSSVLSYSRTEAATRSSAFGYSRSHRLILFPSSNFASLESVWVFKRMAVCRVLWSVLVSEVRWPSRWGMGFVGLVWCLVVGPPPPLRQAYPPSPRAYCIVRVRPFLVLV